MSTSRMFQFAKNVGVASSMVGVGYLSARSHEKRREEFQKEHPNKVVREDFHYVPIVGGFWKFSVDEKATTERNNQSKCIR